MRVLVCLFASLLASGAAAQTTPPRDVARSGATTATIRGRITDAATGRPIAGAIVRLARRTGAAAGSGEPPQAIAGADGRYEVTMLAPGEYMVVTGPPEQSATYLHGVFGSPHPLEAGTGALSAPPLAIAAGETREGVDVALIRALAIEGRVVNEFGEPLADVSVTAEPVSRGFPGQTAVSSDDRGVFRVFGLARGAYRVCGSPDSWVSRVGVGEAPASRLVRTCHPAAVVESMAEAVTLSDADVGGLLIQMQRSSTFTAFGRVIDESGALATDARVSLYRFDRRGSGGSAAQQPDTRSGAFVIRGLTAGEYVIEASAGHPTDPYGQEARERGAYSLRIESSDVSGLVVRTTAGANVAGRVVFEGEGAPPTARLVARAARVGNAFRISGPPAPSPVRDDGTFELKRLFGAVAFSLTGLPPGWVIQSVRFKGEDITDMAVELTSSSDAKDFEVRVSNRAATVTVRPVNSRGAVEPNAVVVLIPADPRRWSGGGTVLSGSPIVPQRASRAVRPGEYLVAAIPFEDAAMRLLDQAALNAAAAKVAQRITLAAGDERTLDVRVTPLQEIR